MIPDGGGCYYDDEDQEFIPPKRSRWQRIKSKVGNTFRGHQGFTGEPGAMGPQGIQGPPGQCQCRCIPKAGGDNA